MVLETPSQKIGCTPREPQHRQCGRGASIWTLPPKTHSEYRWCCLHLRNSLLLKQNHNKRKSLLSHVDLLVHIKLCSSLVISAPMSLNFVPINSLTLQHSRNTGTETVPFYALTLGYSSCFLHKINSSLNLVPMTPFGFYLEGKFSS